MIEHKVAGALLALAYVSLAPGATAVPVNATATTGPTATGAAGVNATISSEISFAFSCQSQYAATSSVIHSLIYDPNNYVYFTTYSNSTVYGTATYGTADIYTTIEDIPHAHGTFTPTAYSNWSATSLWTSTYSTYKTAPYSVTWPGCALDISSAGCSALYSSFRTFLSIGPTAPLPASAYGLTNSPISFCYDPYPATPTPTTQNTATLPCSFQIGSAQIFYWPTTDGGDISSASEPTTTVYSGMTFTSPSVYASIETFGAYRILSSVPKGGLVYGAVGYSYANVWTSFAPSDASTLIRSLISTNPSSVASVLAHGGPKSHDLVNSIYFEDGTLREDHLLALEPERADFARFMQPNATAYYLNQNWTSFDDNDAPPGCAVLAPGAWQLKDPRPPSPECQIIFDDAYYPIFQVPDIVRFAQPEWETCTLPLLGVNRGTAIAIQPAASQALPTAAAPAAIERAAMPASPSTAPAAPTPTATVTGSP